MSSSEGRRPSSQTAESSAPKQEEEKRQHALSSNGSDEMTEKEFREVGFGNVAVWMEGGRRTKDEDKETCKDRLRSREKAKLHFSDLMFTRGKKKKYK